MILIIIMALFFGVLFGIPGYIDHFSEKYIVREPDRLKPADAVMVLGALVHSGGPSSVLKARLEYAYELYADGKANKILLSGDHGQEEYDEVNVMKDYLLEKGVPEEDIFMDHAGFNTYDSMYRAKHVFLVEKMIISTQEFHMPRSVYIARKLGIDAYGYPSPDNEAYHMDYLNRRERLAKIKAFWDTAIVRRDPKYGGDPIPITSSGIVTEG